MRFWEIIYYFLLFGLIFVVYPLGFSQFELPKAVVGILGIGILGPLIFLGLVLMVAKNLIITKEWILLSVLIGFLIVQSYNPVSIVNLIHFWWVLGIGLSKKA